MNASSVHPSYPGIKCRRDSGMEATETDRLARRSANVLPRAWVAPVAEERVPGPGRPAPSLPTPCRPLSWGHGTVPAPWRSIHRRAHHL